MAKQSRVIQNNTHLVQAESRHSVIFRNKSINQEMQIGFASELMKEKFIDLIFNRD